MDGEARVGMPIPTLQITNGSFLTGWVACFLEFAGRRYALRASDVFPPFHDVLLFLRAIATQRLPYWFFWDEEGVGTTFEALAVGNDSPSVHLRICHSDHDAPWIDADVDRHTLVTYWLEELERFAARHGLRTKSLWGVDVRTLRDIRDLLIRPIPPRSTLTVAGQGFFAFRRWPRPGYIVQMDLSILGFMVTLGLEDGDPFWDDWMHWLGHVAQPAGDGIIRWVNEDMREIHAQLVGTPLPALPEYHTIIECLPLDEPKHFRLRWIENSPNAGDVAMVDEVLDRRQFVVAFCEAFGSFLRDGYGLPRPGRRYPAWRDLRSLPIAQMRARVLG